MRHTHAHTHRRKPESAAVKRRRLQGLLKAIPKNGRMTPASKKKALEKVRAKLRALG